MSAPRAERWSSGSASTTPAFGGHTATRRPVELVQLYMVGERGSEKLHLLPTFVEDNGELRPNPVAARASD